MWQGEYAQGIDTLTGKAKQQFSKWRKENCMGFCLFVFKERKAKCQLFDITEDDAGWNENTTTGDLEQHRD